MTANPAIGRSERMNAPADCATPRASAMPFWSRGARAASPYASSKCDSRARPQRMMAAAQSRVASLRRPTLAQVRAVVEDAA
jgi:hypothetical protein